MNSSWDWVMVNSGVMTCSIHLRDTTSKITTTCRRARVKFLESQIQILLGSQVIESGHTRAGVGLGV